MTILTHVIAWLCGVCSGFALAAWLLLEPVHAGDAKYHLRDFKKVAPVVRVNEYGHEPRQWEFRCIGGLKDCGEPTPIPEPGTLALVAIGLVAFKIKRFL